MGSKPGNITPVIYICIPVLNRIEYTVNCIRSIEHQTYSSTHVIVCDDGSTDGTPEILAREFPEVTVLKGNGNLWWAGGTNMCVRKAMELGGEADYAFTLNNDTELEADCLEKLITLEREFPGSVIGSLNVFYNEPGRIEPSAFRKRGKGLFPLMHHRMHNLGDPVPEGKRFSDADAFAGKGVLVPLEIYREIGIYNEEMLPHYHADTEFTLRAGKKGYRLLYSYEGKVRSHQHLTGKGTMNRSFTELLKSFSDQKSANHLPSLRNVAKLAYGKKYRPYYWYQVARVVLGYFKRFFTPGFSSKK